MRCQDYNTHNRWNKKKGLDPWEWVVILAIVFAISLFSYVAIRN